MTKIKANRSTAKAKANRRITKASTSKMSATKACAPTADDACLLVLGFDEQQKPCGARFVGVRIPTIVTTRSDGSRPPVPIDRDQCDGAVRCIC